MQEKAKIRLACIASAKKTERRARMACVHEPAIQNATTGEAQAPPTGRCSERLRHALATNFWRGGHLAHSLVAAPARLPREHAACLVSGHTGAPTWMSTRCTGRRAAAPLGGSLSTIATRNVVGVTRAALQATRDYCSEKQMGKLTR